MRCMNPECGMTDGDSIGDQCVFCGGLLKITGEDVLSGKVYDLVKELRAPQIDYVRTIDKQLERESSVTFIEGGTGVGKSFAYLIPILLKLQRHPNHKAIVVTGNKGLQKQLLRDIPFLLEKMELDIPYLLLKGKGNYACPKLASEVPPHDHEQFKLFTATLPADQDNWTRKDAFWWSNASASNCPDKKCTLPCTPSKKGIRLFITNYHYFGLYLDNFKILTLSGFSGRTGTGENAMCREKEIRKRLSIIDSAINPLPEYVVLDEAHQAPGYIRSVLQTSLKPRGLTRLINMLDDENFIEYVVSTYSTYSSTTADALLEQTLVVRNLVQQLKTSVQETRDALEPLLQTQLPHATLCGDPDGLLRKIHCTEDAQNHQLADTFSALLATSFSRNYTSAGDPHDLFPEGSRIAVRVRRALQLLAKFKEYDPGGPFSLTLDDKGIYLVPLDIGPIAQKVLSAISHVVVTSATLAHSGQDFSFIREQLGYPASGTDTIREKVVGSPFDLKKSARLYVPMLDHIPTGDSLDVWYDLASQEIIQLASASQGGGFVLCSSSKDMQELVKRTAYAFKQENLQAVVQQPNISAAYCKEQYLQNPRSILFGLRSFWEGVDIQGSHLRLVIIPKLPFPVPVDPVVKHLTDAAGGGFKGFRKVAIPLMLETLRQGVGRLIRSKTDKGVVAILDSRAWTGTSSIQKHRDNLARIRRDPKMRPTGYGKNIFTSLGFPVIDNPDYAYRLCKQIFDKTVSIQP